MGKQVENIQSNPEMVRAIEELCGASFTQLIEEGRILNLKGERFIPEGEKVPPSLRETEYSDIESEVIGGLKNDGVLIFPDKNAPNPEPVLVNLKNTTLKISDSINEFALGTILAFQLNKNGKFPINGPEEEVEEPGFFNKLWDGFLGIFGGSTPEMDRYREYQEQVKTADQNSEKLVDIEESIWKQASSIKERSANDKAEIKEQKMTDVTHLFAPEKLGVNVASATEEELDVFNKFADTLKEMAAEDYKMRNLLLVLGKPQSATNPMANSLHTVYAYYRTAALNDEEPNLRQMFNDAIYKKPNQLGEKSLSKIIQYESVTAQSEGLGMN